MFLFIFNIAKKVSLILIYVVVLVFIHFEVIFLVPQLKRFRLLLRQHF